MTQILIPTHQQPLLPPSAVPALALAGHQSTHPLILHWEASLRGEATFTRGDDLGMLNLTGTVFGARARDVHARTRKGSQGRRDAANGLLDSIRFDEACSALSQIESRLKDQRHHDKERAAGTPSGPYSWDLYSDGTKDALIVSMYVMMRHTPAGLYILNLGAYTRCWGGTEEFSGASLEQVSRLHRAALITAGHLTCHPHDRLSPFMRQQVINAGAFPREYIYLPESDVPALEEESRMLGVTTDHNDLHSWMRNIARAWQERGEGTEV